MTTTAGPSRTTALSRWAVLAFAILARRFLDRIGPRVLVLVGTVATAAAAASLLAFEPDSSYAWPLPPALVGLGADVGTTFVANAALAMTDVDEDDTGIASGLLSTYGAGEPGRRSAPGRRWPGWPTC